MEQGLDMANNRQAKGMAGMLLTLSVLYRER